MVVEILVASTQGSAPREAGTRMWVDAASTRGTIGGGNLEYSAIQIAREMLFSGETRRERRFALGDSLGQCCGGSVTLVFERIKEAEEIDEDPRFHVVLFGAGHVGTEVARILGRLPCTVTWADSRPGVFPAEVDGNTRVKIEEDARWVVDDAPPGAFYLVMTHSHALDLEIVEHVLRRSDAGFLGLIGSETKAGKFRLRLQRKNLPVERLVCPVGSFKAGKHPAEVAVSAVAQLLELSASRSGTSAPAPRVPLASSP
jgi:xanthine dehydrogenase accessory factor